MKKALLVGLLVCAILASVVTGTLAVYQATIDETTGDIVAKQFVIDHATSADWKTNLTIAPTETLNYKIDVMNFKGDVVTETKMSIATTFEFPAISGKQSLEPLSISITKTVDGASALTETITLSGAKKTIEFTDVLAASEKHTVSYAVTINWPNGKTNAYDTAFQGAGFGNKMHVEAVGTQVA
ncbi:MAG: hypothetical protein RR327_05170 [Clostridia bacterium]